MEANQIFQDADGRELWRTNLPSAARKRGAEILAPDGRLYWITDVLHPTLGQTVYVVELAAGDPSN